jgi:hypothetical protein
LSINDEFENVDNSTPKRDLLEEIRNETVDWDSGKNGHDLYRSSGHGLTKKSRNKDTRTTNDFYRFIEDIYLNCKKYNIEPSNFIGFIKDLYDFYPSLEGEFHSTNSKKPDLSLSDDGEEESETVLYFTRASNRANDKDITQNLIRGDPSMKQPIESDVSIQIPIISQISYYVNQIKLECKESELHKISLHNEISGLETKKLTLENNIRELIDKHNDTLFHLRWYDFLKQDLVVNYNVNLDQEIMFFSSIINDFKTYNYNILEILKEYKQIQSLRKERDQIQIDLNLKSPLLQSLLQQVDILNSQLDVCRQTMKTYWELSAMGFDLKKLKQLHGMFIEIASANKIPICNAVSKFLNDIENQYDSKLGFEAKIDELITIMNKLKNEIPQFKPNLQNQILVAASLPYLMDNGVTNEDIINMTQIVISLQNSPLLTSILSQGTNPSKGIGNTNTETNSKNETWKLLINKLRTIQSMDSEIQKLNSHRNDLISEITLLDIEKNESEESSQYPHNI